MQQRIRVLFCVQNFNGGGAEGVTLSLVNALDRSAFEPIIFAHERLPWVDLPKISPDFPVLFGNDRPFQRKDLPGLLLRTIQLARQQDVIVGASEGRPTLLGLAAARLTGRPFVVWTHWDLRGFLARNSWRQRLSVCASAGADALVACGAGALSSAVALTGIDPSRARAIPNAIPLAEVRRRAALPLEPEDEQLFTLPTVLAVGALRELKGQDLLVEASRRLRARGVQHRLLLAGTGEMEEQLRARVRSEGLEDTVRFLGYRANPFALMRRCTVFAHAARTEGFGLVLAEALACGAAVVASDCPTGPREVLADGAAGALVPTEDPEALARAIARVLVEPQERARLRAAADLRAPDLDLPRMAEAWSTVLAQVSARPRA